MLWKNGGGITTEIAREPATSEDFDWRVSIAEIAQDGDFSLFPGVDRTLMLLDGGGVELEFGDGTPVQLTQRFARHLFPGEAPVSCRLLDGPTRDFNLMLRRGVVSGELLARPIVGPMVFFAETGVSWLVHVVSGAVQIKDNSVLAEIGAGDTLLLSAATGAAHHTILNGHGELVLARLQRLG
jgi:environmental stress-induced protein Ves